MLIAEFVDAVATGRQPQPDGEVGFRTLQIALAGYESMRTGQPVDITTPALGNEHPR
jgi:predicted dehydrogenase